MDHTIAEVAIPISIALNEPFDYLIPRTLEPAVAAGCRVLVPFRDRLVLGYVLRLKDHSKYENRLRSVIKNLDQKPVLDKELFALAEQISEDYFCPLGDALGTVISAGLKRSKKGLGESHQAPIQEIPVFALTREEALVADMKEFQKPLVLIHDFSDSQRWTAYAALIKKSLNEKRSVIFLVPDHQKIDSSLEYLKLDITPFVISSNISQVDSQKAWSAIKAAGLSFVMGTRSAIFAPVNNLGLVIIEEEEHFAYRQDQVPYYRTSEIAFQRGRQHHARVVMGSFMPSLDSYALSKTPQTGYVKFLRPQPCAPVRIIDMHNEFRFKGAEKIISKILEHHIAAALQRNEKIFIHVNKKGFSTFLYCPKCQKTQACPRCSSSLVYHYKEKIVSCPTCQYKSASFDICPQCQSMYVRFSGYGLEKVESELLRLFPAAKIFIYDRSQKEPPAYDIMLATQQFLEAPYWNHRSFDTVAVLACEQMLGHIDFRSTEKAYGRLSRLQALAKNEIFIQSYVIENDALKFLGRCDPQGFLDNELKNREELNLPPLVKMASLNLRAQDRQKCMARALFFYKRLKKAGASLKSFELFEPVASIPFKVRGNYRYQIFMKYKRLKHLQKIVRSIIQERRQGIIATFDPSL